MTKVRIRFLRIARFMTGIVCVFKSQPRLQRPFARLAIEIEIPGIDILPVIEVIGLSIIGLPYSARKIEIVYRDVRLWWQASGAARGLGS